MLHGEGYDDSRVTQHPSDTHQYIQKDTPVINMAAPLRRSHFPMAFNFSEPVAPPVPPLQPTGPPLLTDDDWDHMNGFFHSDNFGEFGGVTSFGEGLQALETLAPELVGYGTQLSIEADPNMGLDPMAHNINQQPLFRPAEQYNLPVSGPSFPQAFPQFHNTAGLTNGVVDDAITPEVIAAAAALRPHQPVDAPPSQRPQPPQLVRRQAPPTRGPPRGHLRHQQMEEFQRERQLDSHQDVVSDSPLVRGILGASSIAAPHTPIQPSFNHALFGTDPAFQPHARSYEGPGPVEMESEQQERMALLDCLEPDSAIRGSSPSSTSSMLMTPNEINDRRYSDSQESAPDGESYANTKRKRDAQVPAPEGQQPTNAAGKKGKRAREQGQPPNGVQKRRKSSTGKRAPLSIEQKKSNHIASEKRRRGQVTYEISRLNGMVPELKGVSASRAAQLEKTCNFVVKLLRQNSTLHEQLAAIKGTA